MGGVGGVVGAANGETILATLEDGSHASLHITSKEEQSGKFSQFEERKTRVFRPYREFVGSLSVELQGIELYYII